jgi:VIT1/CCC1 family predicted Fe2+/Mn2+ transporter
MSSKPKKDQKAASADATRKPMPFEPGAKSDKTAQVEKSDAKKPARSITGTKPPVGRVPPRSSTGIPEVVSRRMIKRMALFSGVPSALGMSTFIVSYLVVSKDWVALPTYAVLLVSLGWFGLGVVGLSYGVLSASWEEDQPGTRLGIDEFKLNWGRMTENWKENQQRGDRL